MDGMDELTDSCLDETYLVDPQDPRSIKEALIGTLIHVVGKDPRFATKRDWFYATAYLLRGLLSQKVIKTARAVQRDNAKRVYYLSMEYLPGRMLAKTLIDLGLDGQVREALAQCGQDLDAIETVEFDGALGNGGLGRLAACFLDSMATHAYPGFGYGIRYEYGIFTQRIEGGQQAEHPENWLRYGNPWEFERPNVIYPVRFNGRVMGFRAGQTEVRQWVDTDEVIAMAFDTPVSGYQSEQVVNLRLWSARSTRDFDLRVFNEGNYIDAVKDKTFSENLSKVLYPNDKTYNGLELRLKQEYFFVSASLQDILARYKRFYPDLTRLPEQVAIQLNDTHPALAIPELLRLLVDENGLAFEQAYEMAGRIFAYTNHTLLPEALETWPIETLERVLPRHLEIIFRINHDFLRQLRHAFPGDHAVISRLSLVDDGARRIRMAHLAVVVSHKVNGVAALHTKLLQSTLFADFARLWPHKFINQTNGITPRRWLKQANPSLAALIDEAIGPGWAKDLIQLSALKPFADDTFFREQFMAIKRANKERLARMIKVNQKLELDPDTLFDTQVKRIHEYKRQLLNLLHVIARYRRLRDNPGLDGARRTVIFAGKAAPGYAVAKQIIRLINDVAETVNSDPLVADRLKVAFIPNYNVSSAEIIIPGSDLSEQISTAGTEASGTGNMKFALNGALTIGTLDGANIEIKDEVGQDNIFIFGLTAEEAHDLKLGGYDPWRHVNDNPELKQVLDMIGTGFFSPEEPDRYRLLTDTLLRHGDYFLLLADYAAYIACQERVAELYRQPHEWARRAILNVANMGMFSSDRTIHGYARDIWRVKPLGG